ncbi:MAG: hypothetical protein LBT74_12245 [Acidobacteriota bacterium]|jgi:hypothetical protein|nr:hypothetical protein [Acidobacteriota bacterium]
MKMRFTVMVFAAALACSTAARAADYQPHIECNRQCLAGFMDTYLKALIAHDSSKLPVTKNVKYTENGVRLNLTDGLWHTVTAMPTYRLDVIDEYSGQVGLLGIINENGNKNWFAVRLKVEKGKQVSEIENLVVRNIMGGMPADGPELGAALAEPHPLMMQAIPAGKRSSHAELAAIGDSYFAGLDTENDGKYVPFDPACQRRENGMVTANNTDSPKGSMQWLDCKAQFDTHFSTIVTDIRERRFIADPETGLSFGWGYFDHDGSVEKMASADGKMEDVSPTFRMPFSFYIAEIFKVVDGKIRQIEAVLTTVPFGMESTW